MKLIHYVYLALAVTLVLSGCVPASSTVLPTQVEAQPSLPAFVQPTSTPTLAPTGTATYSTLPATLKPEQAKATMSVFLQKPTDCQAPCFWGVTPEQTTLEEAKNIFTHLGLEINSTTFQGKDFYGIAYDFDDFSISENLAVQDNIVKNLTINIHPEKQQAGIPRKWLVYSPETLIRRYGLPSKVNFAVDRSTHPAYTMDMYFDKVDLIIGYSSYDLGPKMQVCPLVNQMDYIRIWLGSHPQNPPPFDPTIISLEEATSMTMEEFSNLMTGDPKKACFNFDEKKFP